MKKKERLLQRLKREYPDIADKELYAAVMCGEIFVDKERLRDANALVYSDSLIKFRQKKYVSRGGYKLEQVLDLWRLPVKGRRILDAGSSSGGFTDCLLQNGASLVFAVDVGFNQLDYSLRTNPCVVVMESTNIMLVDKLYPKPDWAVADLSFRSLRRAASHILSLTQDKRLVALMKPQFELRTPDDQFDGIIRDNNQLLNIAKMVIDQMRTEGAYVTRAALSPLKGRKGNQELFLDISRESGGPSTRDIVSLLASELQ